MGWIQKTWNLNKYIFYGLSEEEVLAFIKSKFEPLFGPMVATLDNTGGFGDKALLADNPKQAVRNATVIAHEFT